MSERTTGIWSAFSMARVYSGYQALLGAHRVRRLLVDEFIRPEAGNRILDVGCGPADILEALPPDIEYTGIDHSEAYIEKARSRNDPRATFFVEDAANLVLENAGAYQRIIATGLLHHIDDDASVAFFETCRKLLAPGGFLVTFDGAFTENQNPVAWWLLRMDRGTFVRTADEYLALAAPVFPKTAVVTRTDLLRVPYTHAIMTCER